MAIPPFGSPPTPDSTATIKGKLKLAGDLTGTADLPVLASVIVAGSVGSATQVPVLAYDAKGRITSVSAADIVVSDPDGLAFFLS